MKITISDRITFSLEALRKHLFILLGGLLFITIGSILIYIGTRVNNDHYFFYIFGGVFILFILFFWSYTLPSSLLFYYDKAMTKKHGIYGTASITKKTIEDHPYENGIGKNKKYVEHYMYLIEYQFEYQFEYRNKINHGAFYLNKETVFNTLKIGDLIAIKFLRTNPEKSNVRRQKLCLDLGFNRNMCN